MAIRTAPSQQPQARKTTERSTILRANRKGMEGVYGSNPKREMSSYLESTETKSNCGDHNSERSEETVARVAMYVYGLRNWRCRGVVDGPRVVHWRERKRCLV